MQFLFGNDTKKYTVLYADDSLNKAQDVMDLIRLHYDPSNPFDTFGYLPFGENYNSPLFFNYRKDLKFDARGVYYLHGFYSNNDPEFFYNDDYQKFICANVIGQEEFNRIRDAKINEGFVPTLPPYGGKLSEEKPVCNDSALTAIIDCLYQRQKVAVVIESERFNRDARPILLKIFRLLTPSLRRECSFVSGIEDHSSGFMLQILPDSMKTSQDYVEIAVSKEYSSALYSSFAREGVSSKLDDNGLQVFFNHYERLFYGKSSVFKKSHFDNYVDACLSDNDAELLQLIYKHILDFRFDNDPVLPSEFITKIDKEYNGDPLGKINSFSIDDFGDPEKYLQENELLIKTAFYLYDKELKSLKEQINNASGQAFDYSQKDHIDSILSNYDAQLSSFDQESQLPYQKAYFTIVGQGIKNLKAIISECESLELEYRKKVKSKVEIISRPKSTYYISRELSNLLPSTLLGVGRLSKIETCVPDFSKHLTDVAEGLLIAHNKELERRQFELKKQAVQDRIDKDQDYKKAYNCFDLSVDMSESQIAEILLNKVTEALNEYAIIEKKGGSKSDRKALTDKMDCAETLNFRSIIEENEKKQELVLSVYNAVEQLCDSKSRFLKSKSEFISAYFSKDNLAEEIARRFIESGKQEQGILYAMLFIDDSDSMFHFVSTNDYYRGLDKASVASLCKNVAEVFKLRLNAAKNSSETNSINDLRNSFAKHKKTIRNQACFAVFNSIGSVLEKNRNAASDKRSSPQDRLSKIIIISFGAIVIILIAVVCLVITLKKPEQGDGTDSQTDISSSADISSQVSPDTDEPVESSNYSTDESTSVTGTDPAVSDTESAESSTGGVEATTPEGTSSLADTTTQVDPGTTAPQETTGPDTSSESAPTTAPVTTPEEPTTADVTPGTTSVPPETTTPETSPVEVTTAANITTSAEPGTSSPPEVTSSPEDQTASTDTAVTANTAEPGSTAP